MASSKRERELARMRAERQAARRAVAEARRRKQRGVLLGGLTGLVVVAIAVGATLALAGGDDTKDTLNATPGASSSATPSAAPPGTGTGVCKYTGGSAAAKPVTGLPPESGVETVKASTATLTTNRGVVTLKLDTPKAPCTVNSFTFLAKQKYFDGTTCHRLTTSGIFVLQCGDPSATGSGGPGYAFADENLEGATYPAGTVAMANSGAGTNGSQFFLVYKDTQLPPSYTPFATIAKGLDVLTKVAAAGIIGEGGDGKPQQSLDLVTTVVKQS